MASFGVGGKKDKKRLSWASKCLFQSMPVPERNIDKNRSKSFRIHITDYMSLDLAIEHYAPPPSHIKIFRPLRMQ
jgi:hypothetical protein